MPPFDADGLQAGFGLYESETLEDALELSRVKGEPLDRSAEHRKRSNVPRSGSHCIATPIVTSTCDTLGVVLGVLVS